MRGRWPGGWTLDRHGKGKPGYCQGIVYDSSGEVLIGAMLRTSQGMSGTTDVDGTFSIPVRGTALLTVSYVGYEPATVSVTSGGLAVISLNNDDSSLEEVVVCGMASSSKLSAPVIKRDMVLKSEGTIP